MAFLKVDTLHLFRKVRDGLLELLAELDEEEWGLPTVCEAWDVKDVALHLLGVDIGNISRRRDGIESGLLPGQSLVTWLNEGNEGWVRATRRMSPSLLISLLDHTGKQFDEYLAGLDEDAVTAHVSWASDEPVPVWLDIAREYTERWVHQQQIRDATDRRGLKDEEFLRPVIETFVHSLPMAYREVEAAEGSAVQLLVKGVDGSVGAWHVSRQTLGWDLQSGEHPDPRARVTLDSDGAWRLFTRNPQASAPEIDGDEALGRYLVGAVAIIA